MADRSSAAGVSVRSRATALLASWLSLAVLLASPPVRADEPVRYRALLAAGYGTQDDSDAGSFGAAFGFKLGISPIPFLHLGAQGTYHVGTQFDDEVNRVHYFGAEAGARFADARVGVTPYLTVGAASVSSQRNVDSSFLTYEFGLGLCADVIAVDWLMFGVDARLIVIPEGVRQSDNSGNAGTFDLLALAGVQL